MEIVPASTVANLQQPRNPTTSFTPAEAAWLRVLWREMDTQDILGQIIDAVLAGKLVIPLMGPSGAGKSTLARLLAKLLSGVVLRLDDLCLREADRDTSVPEGKFDCKEADRLLRGLVAGQVVHYMAWDPGSGERCIPTILVPRRTVIFDGVLASRVPAAMELSQTRGFVDANPEVRRQRVLHRAESGEERSRYFGRELAARFDERVQNEDAAVFQQLPDCTFYLSTTTLPSPSAHQS